MARVQFDLKHFEQITASLLNFLASVQTVITDFNVGSVNRTLVESFAMELEEFYYRLYKALEAAIPEAMYTAFDFTLAPATAATGTVTFGRSTPADADYGIPDGTRVATADGVVFHTIGAATLVTGQTSVSVPIVAVTAGAAGNVAAQSITQLQTAILGIETVTNAAATTGGTDEESEGSRKTRFQDFISTLARAPINGIEAGAKTVRLVDSVTGSILERVRLAKVVEPYLTDPGEPVGLFTVYIDNGSGTASNSLVSRTQEVLDGYLDEQGGPVIGYRAAGVIAEVVAATPVAVNVQVTGVTLKSGASLAAVQTALAAAAAAVFDRLGIGDSLDWEALLAALMAAEGVRTLVLTTPAADVTAQVGQRLRLGTMTVTAA